ncbi:glycoside hydrolase family 16 protein [Plicaturopsis crispa FD-325 SS-3]|nr:glycoside hydrolase family 16 protein [Plicaturopsis crispa FD-325 SS-3]
MLNILALLPLFIAGVAAQGGQTCNVTSPCSSDAPCCSEFGFCGDGNFCLGGCNPLASKSLTSCMPNPICQSANHTFADNSRILSNATYFGGNASAYDWVVDKGNIMNTNTSGGELVLLLTEDNGGTRLSSTRYMHYGTVTARMKTGRWVGVVTAFITMSSIKDEIDWEFPGNKISEGQTNYFWQGNIPATSNGATTSNLQDTSSNYHEYTIDWQPDTLSFLVDGNNVRTIQRADTIDKSTGASMYPDTPSRIQLSLWPAGINSSAPGTVQWAGGMIDWTDPDYVKAGHFSAFVSSVSVKCADPQQPSANMTSYVYGANSTANTPSIAFSDETTINGATTISRRDMFGVALMLVLSLAVGTL